MGSPDLGHRSVDIENGSKHHDYTVIVRIYIYIYIYMFFFKQPFLNYVMIHSRSQPLHII